MFELGDYVQKDTTSDDIQYIRSTELEIYNKLNTSDDGLSKEEAKKRLEKYGSNEIKKKKERSLIKMFFNQFKDVLTIVLLVAIGISLLLFFLTQDNENLIDVSVISAILVINAIIGVRQEYKSEKALEALKKLSAPEATVIRDNKMTKIPSREVVPGDYLILQTGDKVVADTRLTKTMNIKIDESMLTGESVPVTKKSEIIDKEKVPLSERKNIAHSGTIVTYGGGEGVVFRTGMETEMGKIADLIQSAKEKQTPLTKKLAQLSKWLTILIVIICVIVFIVGTVRTVVDKFPTPLTFGDYEEMFLAAVGLAVAAIPEGLPAIVTIALSLGVSRMVEKNAIIRRLSAVETLGSATIICSDKTGTLTQNEMTIREVYVNKKNISVTGVGYEPKGEFKIDNKTVELKDDPHFRLLCRIGILCSDAELNYNEKEEDWEIFGDPTEASLLVLGGKIDMWKKELLKKYPKKNVLPFDSNRKMMTTVHETPNGSYAYVKGAPEQILDRCIKKYTDRTETDITEDEKDNILELNEEMTKNALRTLALAYTKINIEDFSEDEIDSEHIEKNLIFVGLVGMIDPPREESKRALKVCKNAGMKAVIITGDHKLTATAIAKELDMMEKNDIAITGSEVDEMSDDEFDNIVTQVKVFARVSPHHKVKVCKSLQEKGNVVAMTGDGVNDSPAIKTADIGVAMGQTGTEVTKEAADMTLMDDNFATIINAVREGRGIYDNIRKFIFYLLSSNIGEILTLFIAILIGFHAVVGGELILVLPLVPVQILWINLVTDGLPATALSVEPKDPDLMNRPPRDPKEPVITKKMVLNMLLVGATMCIGTLFAFNIGLNNYSAAHARTLSFTTLMMFQMFNVISCRSFRESIFKLKTHNKALYIAILSSIILQIVVVYVPGVQTIFYCTNLNWIDWILLVAISSSVLFVNEIYKWIIRKRSK
ncbi:MAG: calcium-translocating P-type ATPase, SERCA-type [Promethearchaeota archaeon]|nr:MAG: calcium-translocating P-type ATPase, SERCA-type [Candidatus Lokiarchaeota archaeon]